MLINKHTFSSFRNVARGLAAQRIAMGTVTENIANASTTRTAEGTPYAIKRALHEVEDNRYSRFDTLLNKIQGDMELTDNRHFVGSSLRRRLSDIEMGPLTTVEPSPAYRTEFDPTHPHADEQGYVQYPDINVVEEMARLVSAHRIYEANLSAFQTAKEMTKRTLEI